MKKNVHYLILEDMKKYIKNFNEDNYEESHDVTDSAVIKYVRKYYDKHLPIDLNAWFRVNIPKEKLPLASDLYQQVSFVREELCDLLNVDYEKNPPMVIFYIYSNGVKLPIYQLNLQEHGVEIVFGYDFYNWKVSVKSSTPLDFDIMDVFDASQTIYLLNPKEFPRDKIYGCYNQSNSQFTFAVRTSYELYTFLFLLRNYLCK